MTIGERDDTRNADAPCGGRALCGWSPPSLVADTNLKRRVDLIRVGNAAAVGTLIVVVGLLNLAAHLQIRSGLVTYGLAGLLAGAWCSLNFWRCRHAHCLITGPGWVAFGLFAVAEAGIGHSLIGGYEQPIFLAILGVAVVFEIAWSLFHHTNAIGLRPAH
jgi:hypothetical protein